MDCFFDLIRYALTKDESVLNTVDLSDQASLEKLLRLSSKHHLTHLIYTVLTAKGRLEKTNPLYPHFRNAFLRAVLHGERAEAALKQIRTIFEREKIPFIVLKGSVIRKLYPETWMRNSCDIDVLVKKEDLERAKKALLDENYIFDRKTTHNITLFSTQKVCLELHFELNEPMFKRFAVLEKVWEVAEADVEGYEYLLTDKVFYLYHIAHMAKHIANGGCGVRPFIDLWLLNNVEKFNRQERAELLEKEGLLPFERCARKLSEIWFSQNEEHDELTAALEQYVLFGGAYGDAGNKQAALEEKAGGSNRFLFNRIFAPYEKLKILYPVLEEHKSLTPLFQIVRWFRLTSKKSRDNAMQQLRESKKMEDSQRTEVSSLLSNLEINY